ncbi:MAG: NUDIX domain-containing protein [Oscillospiraceae bacterium]|nr:NUDIX domain-containing protein [Oscillospiraceae bacterium]
MEEWLDVYDERHALTGRSVRRGEAVSGTDRLLAVHVCVLDGQNRLLIQHRHPQKDRYPGCWDLSAGGFAQRGETSREAALRELREELGITLPAEELRFLFTEPFSRVLDDCYLARLAPKPEELRLQQEEVTEVRWVTWEELLLLLRDGRFVDYPEAGLAKIFCLATKRK